MKEIDTTDNKQRAIMATRFGLASVHALPRAIATIAVIKKKDEKWCESVMLGFIGVQNSGFLELAKKVTDPSIECLAKSFKKGEYENKLDKLVSDITPIITAVFMDNMDLIEESVERGEDKEFNLTSTIRGITGKNEEQMEASQQTLESVFPEVFKGFRKDIKRDTI